MLTLYGSHLSPYVRRIRLFLDGKDFTFVPLDVYGSEREMLTQKNPTQKIPMLEDDGQVIYDSNVIYRYLSEKFGCIGLDWQQENLLTCINAVNDAMLYMMMMRRSEFDTDDDRFFFNLQRERAAVIFDHLDDEVAKGQFAEWDFPAIALYCVLDWVNFRSLYDWSHCANLRRFYSEHQHRPDIMATAPTVSE